MSTPLGKTVGGFLLAALDFRINGLDLLPDPLGWAIAAIGLSALSARSPALRVAMILAAIEAVVSLPLVVTDEIPPLLSSLDTLLQTGFVFAVCTGLIALLPHRPDRAGTANIIRWLDLGLTVLIVPVAMTAGSSPEGLARVGPFAIVLVLVGLAVAAWFVVLHFQVRRDPAVGGPANPGAA